MSLLDNPIAEPERPLEVLRTVHSFDPCLAGAVHILDTNGSRKSAVDAGCFTPDKQCKTAS
jgi:hydrogenase large subunit